MVLPFLNLSGDPAQEYFSDAMTDSVILELARAAPESLAVIARTTSMRYRGTQKNVARVGRELNLDYLVEGGVWRTADRVTINVQIIQVGEQTHLFAKRYDAPALDVFGMHIAIARDVVTRIDMPDLSDAGRPSRAGPGVVVRPTDDAEAYNLYLRGRYELHKFVPESIARARQCLEEAVTRDPNFALAHDALAEVLWYMGFLGLAPPRDVFAAGTWAALRAVEIDSSLADAHALLGMYRKELDYNWPEVEREMQLARELSPASPTVRLRYAISGLMPHGRLAEASSELERALESDPLSTFTLCWLAVVHDLARQYDRGLEQVRRVLALDPDSYLGHFAAGHLYRDMQRLDEAVAAFRLAAALAGDSPLMLGWLGMVLALSDNETEARGILAGLQRLAPTTYVPPTSFAWIHLGLGEADRAFSWMDRAIDGRDPMIMPIMSYPFLDAVRDEPRYPLLLRKMNLRPSG